nr:immunoglobulin heavy chain junction region [Macaca mulatta]
CARDESAINNPFDHW